MDPETLAILAQIASADAELRVPTGEPCRCPESQLHCNCPATR